MPEGNPTEPLPHHLPWRQFAVSPKVEAWLRIDVRMPPPIQNDSRNVLLRIESSPAEQSQHLLANLPLVISIAGGKQFRPTLRSLVVNRLSRVIKRHVESDDNGLIRVQRRPIVAYDHGL